MTQGSSFTLMWERVYWQRPLGLSKLSLFVFEEQEEGQCDRSMAKGQCVGDKREERAITQMRRTWEGVCVLI